jgi:hypothetical protein
MKTVYIIIEEIIYDTYSAYSVLKVFEDQVLALEEKNRLVTMTSAAQSDFKALRRNKDEEATLEILMVIRYGANPHASYSIVTKAIG